MTTQNNQALRITELDFLSIKENLKNYLRNQSEFQDFDFEGSGMSVLLDILAYNTHYMSFYLNMIGNEMFLDTAQIRASVLSHAKMIGYIPNSKQGAEAKVNIKVTPSINEPNTSVATLEKYTRFLAQDIDGINYPFVTLYSNTVSKANGTFDFNNISIKQGEVVTLQYLMEPSNTNRRFEIPSANVDINTLSITVQESTSNTFATVYNVADDITELTSTTPAYFIEENENLNYTFYFGDDVIGKKPKVGNVIICTYIDTIGSAANNISKFNFVDPVAGYNDNVSITTITTSYGGQEKETIEQTRFRAPYYYTTQNRAVTKTDYETLVLKDFPNIQTVSVWGGEENDPVVYGKMYLSLRAQNDLVLSELEKQNIKDSLQKRNVFAIIPEIVDPDYSYITIAGKVYYNPNLTTKTANEILTLVKAAISDYSEQELNTFNSIFKKTKLEQFIESVDSSIIASDIDTFIQKRLILEINQTKNYQLLFNTKLRKGDFNEKISSFPQVTVRDIDGLSRNVFFEEVPQSFTGVDSISIVNPGINYQSAPTVTISGDGIGATAQAFIINGRVDRIEITNKGSDYTRASVSITGGGGSEAVASAVLQQNNGTLRTYYYRSNGEKVIINNNAGTIDYLNGKIFITNLLPISVVSNPFYDDNILTIKAPIHDQVIYPLRNRILTIDDTDSSAIQIEVIAR